MRDSTDHARAADAHMRLSALHLERALTLEAVRREPVGSVHPLPEWVEEKPLPVTPQERQGGKREVAPSPSRP